MNLHDDQIINAFYSQFTHLLLVALYMCRYTTREIFMKDVTFL